MFQRTNGRIMLSDVMYSLGKKLVQVWIPAVSALYFGLGKIWGFPATEQIVGSLAVVATFLGVSLHLSSSQYDASGAAHDGEVVIENTDEGKKMFTLALNGDPAEIEGKKSVSFKVAKK